MGKGPRTAFFPAAYMLVQKDNQLLFVLRTNTGFMDGYYSLPAGRVEPAEPFRAAAIREAAEETGVTVLPKDARQVFTHQRYQGAGNIWVDIYFSADHWSGTPANTQPEEHGAIAWFPVDALPGDKILDYQYAALQGILRGEAYGEFGWPVTAAETAATKQASPKE